MLMPFTVSPIYLLAVFFVLFLINLKYLRIGQRDAVIEKHQDYPLTVAAANAKALDTNQS